MSSVLDPGRKQRREARRMAAEQTKKEQLRLAEEESEVKERMTAARSGQRGRSLLIKTSPTGTTNTLGGT